MRRPPSVSTNARGGAEIEVRPLAHGPRIGRVERAERVGGGEHDAAGDRQGVGSADLVLPEAARRSRLRHVEHGQRVGKSPRVELHEREVPRRRHAARAPAGLKVAEQAWCRGVGDVDREQVEGRDVEAVAGTHH